MNSVSKTTAVLFALILVPSLALGVELNGSVGIEWQSADTALVEVSGGDEVEIDCSAVNSGNYDDFDETLNAKVNYNSDVYQENVEIDWTNSTRFEIIPPENDRFFSCSGINSTNYNEFDAQWSYTWDVTIPDVDIAVDRIINLTNQLKSCKQRIEDINKSTADLRGEVNKCREAKGRVEARYNICQNDTVSLRKRVDFLEANQSEQEEKYESLEENHTTCQATLENQRQTISGLKSKVEEAESGNTTTRLIFGVIGVVAGYIFWGRNKGPVNPDEEEFGWGEGW